MAQFHIPDRNKTREMRYQMGWKLADMAAQNPDIRVVDADLRSSTGIHIFEHFHPEKLVKVGIAEQNMVAIAAGMSQEGLVPFTCTFDAFSRRCMDQIYVSVAYSDLNIKMIGAYAGLFTGKAGATHQSDKELGFLLRVPNLTVLEPSCNEEMRQVFQAAADTHGPFYLRVVRCNVAENEVFPGYEFRIGKGVTVAEYGADAGIVCSGYMLAPAKLAAAKLAKQGIRVRVDHHPSLKPFDRELLYDLAGKVGAIVTCENHCTSGGLFSLVAEALVRRGCAVPVAPVGTDPEDFIHTGHVNDLMAHYQMTSDDIADRVKQLLK